MAYVLRQAQEPAYARAQEPVQALALGQALAKGLAQGPRTPRSLLVGPRRWKFQVSQKSPVRQRHLVTLPLDMLVVLRLTTTLPRNFAHFWTTCAQEASVEQQLRVLAPALRQAQFLQLLLGQQLVVHLL